MLSGNSHLPQYLPFDSADKFYVCVLLLVTSTCGHTSPPGSCHVSNIPFCFHILQNVCIIIKKNQYIIGTSNLERRKNKVNIY